MSRVAVMGGGSWGTAFATICVDAGGEVALWARREAVAAAITEQHRNPEYLPDVALPPSLRATTDARAVLAGADVVVLALPAQVLRENLERWVGLVPADAVVVSLAKGVERRTRLRPTEVASQVLGVEPERVAVVSGPNLALECARRVPTGSVAAAADPGVAERVRAACATPAFLVEPATDVVGVELGGAFKNVIAIAAGMADGMGYGDNTKSTILTRGLAEMTRLGVALGADAATFSGLAGMGDLTVTAMSPRSRNHHLGEELGRGRSLADVVAETRMIAEGAPSARPILDLATAAGVEVPIVEQIVSVVDGGENVRVVARRLLGRAPKPELYGLGTTAAAG